MGARRLGALVRRTLRSHIGRLNRFGRLGLAATVTVGGFAAVSLTLAAPSGADQTTIGYDSMRTAWDPAEPKLAPASVLASDFGQLFSTTLPRPAGQTSTTYPNSLYAQPLLVDGVLVVATEENQIDGLDPVTGHVLWTKYLGPGWTPPNCGDLLPHIGITSTPVYDPSTKTLYLTTKTDDGPDPDHPHFRLHGVDPQTGLDRTGWPKDIAGSSTNGGQVFNPSTANQRPGLLLMGGSVYMGFASNCDRGPYVGYVAGVNTVLASHPVTFWSTESNLATDQAGIWQSGGGLVSDGPGRIFLATGNGVSPAPGPGTSPPGTLGESVVRLDVAANGVMTAKDYFSPANNHNLDQNDTDLGSGAPVALPNDYGTASHPHLLVQIGKDGNVFLLDRDNLGGTAQGVGGTNKVVSTVQLKGLWGRPALFSSGGSHYIYFVQNSGPMEALRVAPNAQGVPTLSVVGATAMSFPYTSGSPVVTSTGTDPATALIWVVRSGGGSSGTSSTLLAYHAVPPTSGAWDPIFTGPLGTVSKFISPATDNGRVYVGTRDGRVLGFGRPVQAALNAPSTEFGSQAVGTTSAVKQVTVSVQTTVTVNSVSTTGPFAAGTPSVPLPHQFTAGSTFTVPVTFSPAAAGSASGLLHFLAGSTNDPYDFSLHGTGTHDGLSADPASVDFGSVSTSASSQLGVTIQNTGTSTATITAISLPGAPFTVTGLPAIGATLAPQGSVTATLLFKPTAQQAYSANLTVTADTGAVTVPLAGVGVAGSPHLTLDPPTLDFGPVQPGATKTLTFTVTNTGNATLTITKAAPPSAPFVVAVPLSEGQSVSPGDKLTVSVKYVPTKARPVTDHYSITGNDGQGAQLVTVSGNTQPPIGPIKSPLTCLTVRGNVLARGTPIVGDRCTGTSAQGFSMSGASLHLGAATSPWCVDVRSSGTASGTPVQLWTCNGTAAQQWQWRSDNSLYYALGAKCLDLTGSSTVADTPLQIYGCNKTNAQYWDLSPLESARGLASSGVAAANQICMQTRGGSAADNTPVEIDPCNAALPAQMVTDVTSNLRLLGQCVTTTGTANTSLIVLKRCTAASSQLWVHRTDNTVFNQPSGRCLTVFSSVTTPKTQLKLTNCNTLPGERWLLP